MKYLNGEMHAAFSSCGCPYCQKFLIHRTCVTRLKCLCDGVVCVQWLMELMSLYSLSQNISNPRVSRGRNTWKRRAHRLLQLGLSNLYDSHTNTHTNIYNIQ